MIELASHSDESESPLSMYFTLAVNTHINACANARIVLRDALITVRVIRRVILRVCSRPLCVIMKVCMHDRLAGEMRLVARHGWQAKLGDNLHNFLDAFPAIMSACQTVFLTSRR